VTGELDPWRLNLHTKMMSGGNGMWDREPAQRKDISSELAFLFKGLQLRFLNFPLHLSCFLVLVSIL